MSNTERSPIQNKSPTRPSTSPQTGSQSLNREQTPSRDASKQYAELMVKLHNMTREHTHLHQELESKASIIDELQRKAALQEKKIRASEDERQQLIELFDREVAFYKEQIEEVQRRNHRLLAQLELRHDQLQRMSDELEERYEKLLKSHKVLESNFELEQNSKALLIDQIEFLTKERDFLLESSVLASRKSLGFKYLHGQNSDIGESDLEASDVEVYTGGSNVGFESSHGSVNGSQVLNSLADDLEDVDASSPIKDTLLEASRNFQFPPVKMAATSSISPPMPDPNVVATKRQSLPAQLKLSLDDGFVLSPLKLANITNGSYFDADDSVQTPMGSTLTSSKRNTHHRFNSHDILPIKVEFEQRDAPKRHTSVPEYYKRLMSVNENAIPEGGIDEAYLKLNGYGDVLKRDSLVTSSSKRSSMLLDSQMLLAGDNTKQEIMKLKFELQSLKLHNEKLLSYIGFELQKQKKNIKKLLSKQNLRGGIAPKNDIEYSDAKLIEKLRNMLIHKKRVLRSVLINPSTPSDLRDPRVSAVLGGLGIFGSYLNEEDGHDDFQFRSDFISSLNSEKHFRSTDQRKSRSSPDSQFNYLNELEERIPKKYKSQVFRAAEPDLSSIFSEDLLDEVEEEEESDEAEESSAESSVDYVKLNTFNQMRYLVFGKEHFRKSTREEVLVDENLKYKFLSIVVGILIVGARLTHLPPHE